MEAGSMIARPRPADNALSLIEEQFPMERREQIAAYLNIDADHPGMIPYLAICAQYGLHPLMGQIWLIEVKGKSRSKDGEGKEREVKKLAPVVGRDGFLAIANRTPEYEGMQYGVVCERDSFDVEWTGNRDDPKVIHRYASKPIVTEMHEVNGKQVPVEDPGRWRGKILGAWCKVFVKGRVPTFYYAPMTEHAKVGTNDDGSRYMQGAWNYTSGMILKSAQSWALRLALGITGIVPADEMVPEGDRPTAVAEPPSYTEMVEGLALPDSLKADLVESLEVVNELEPNSWGAAKVQMRLTGRSMEEAEQVLSEIQEDARKLQKRAAERAEAQHTAAAEEAPAEDAVLVVKASEVEEGDRLEEQDGAEVLKVVVSDDLVTIVVDAGEGDANDLEREPDQEVEVRR